MGLRDLFASKVMPSGGVDVPAALQLLAKGAVLVDVRTYDEYVAGHVPGARLVDPHELVKDPFNAVHAENPFAEPGGSYVLICDIGLRSGHIARQLKADGHQAEFVEGGLVAWRKSGEVLIPGPPRNRPF